MVFDNAAFFGDFAIDLTVNGVQTRGIFDDAYAEAFAGMVGGTAPALILPSSVAVQRGHAVVVDGTGYTVTSIEPDGTGITLLRLSES